MPSTTRRHTSRGQSGLVGTSASVSAVAPRDKPAQWTDELVQEERQKLIDERQSEATRILNRHDDLVSPLVVAVDRPLTSASYARASTFRSSGS